MVVPSRSAMMVSERPLGHACGVTAPPTDHESDAPVPSLPPTAADPDGEDGSWGDMNDGWGEDEDDGAEKKRNTGTCTRYCRRRYDS